VGVHISVANIVNQTTPPSRARKRVGPRRPRFARAPTLQAARE
jgi:hypothetical protein